MTAPTLSLYIHWPFCRSKCPYCDFNSHLANDIDTDIWQQAFLDELETRARHIYACFDQPDGSLMLSSIFFGGGTPSLMPERLAAALIEAAGRLFQISSQTEITAEANPTSAETEKLTGFAAAGINRLSLGVQSLDETGLRFLGREHSGDEARRALDRALSLFGRVSADLIYGLPEQRPSQWQSQLEAITTSGAGHLSCYQLTIEPGTQFYARAKHGEVLTSDTDMMADLYLLTEALLAGRGFDAYEISNYARDGEQCRHNLNYWRAGNWLGLGPGAHGRITYGNKRCHMVNRRSPQGWLESTLKSGQGLESAGFESPQAQFEEYWMMGLRLTQGAEWPGPVYAHNDAFSLNRHWLDIFTKEQWLYHPPGRLAPTLEGRLRLNAMLSRLLDSGA